jgi:hypothetical protein
MNQDIIKKQVILQQQAKEVLSRLDLINILSKHGKVDIVGSLALNLMTWPDIDIDLKSAKEINKKSYFEIIQRIFNQKSIKQLMLIDNRNSFEKNRPQSMYIGIIYNLNGIDWKIDIRYLNSSAAYANKDLKQIKSRLTPENIKKILKIKTAFHNHPKYGKEFSGYEIYKYVLDKNISTVEEFASSLKKKGVIN